ncbi:MAG: hypothetical protein JSV78_02055, partial [Phycisphaerales bacterium]
QAFDDIEAAFRTSSPEEAYARLQRWRITHVLVGSAEHERFGTLSQFADSTYFENVYNDRRAAVYGVIARDQEGGGVREDGFDTLAGGSP